MLGNKKEIQKLKKRIDLVLSQLEAFKYEKDFWFKEVVLLKAEKFEAFAEKELNAAMKQYVVFGIELLRIAMVDQKLATEDDMKPVISELKRKWFAMCETNKYKQMEKYGISKKTTKS